MMNLELWVEMGYKMFYWAFSLYIGIAWLGDYESKSYG